MNWPLAVVLVALIAALAGLAAWTLWLYATGAERAAEERGVRHIDWPATEPSADQ